MLGLHQNEEGSGHQIHWDVMGHGLILELSFTMMFFQVQGLNINVFFKNQTDYRDQSSRSVSPSKSI